MKTTTKALFLVIILLSIIIISVGRDCKKQAPLRGAGLSAEGVSKPTKQSYEVGKQEIKSARLPTESNNAPSVGLTTGEFERATHQNRQRFKIARVVDGDTVALIGRCSGIELPSTGEKLRYIGVDTPETKHPGKPVEYFGKEASAFNKNLVSGQEIEVEFDVQKRDRYGRLLGYVFLPDGTFVNAELVQQGYAKVYTYPPNVRYAELFRKLQSEAIKHQRGLWK